MTNIIVIAASAFVIGINIGFLLGSMWNAHCTVSDQPDIRQDSGRSRG